jgi:hypothetical protein
MPRATSSAICSRRRSSGLKPGVRWSSLYREPRGANWVTMQRLGWWVHAPICRAGVNAGGGAQGQQRWVGNRRLMQWAQVGGCKAEVWEARSSHKRRCPACLPAQPAGMLAETRDRAVAVAKASSATLLCIERQALGASHAILQCGHVVADSQTG